MITLTILSCVAVLISSILLFRRELNISMQNKIDVAVNVVEHEIEYMIEKAYFAAFAMSSHPDLIEALNTNDRERAVGIAELLKVMASIDYCVLIDRNGDVVARTLDPEQYGDNVLNLPHVRSALSGNIEACIMQGVTVPLGASASAPVYDESGNIIGAVSLGFLLNDQSLVYKLRELTGCEITIFRDDERIASTVLTEDGAYAMGTRAAEHISEIVLAGGSYSGIIELFGENVLASYTPLYGADDTIVGMIFVGFFTEEDTNKIQVFILSGAVITLGVLVICIVIAMYISEIIDRRLEDAHNKLARTYETNELQLVMLDAVVKATKMALWDMEVEVDDPVNPVNKFLWSPEFRELLGFSNEEEFPNVLSSWSDRLHPDDKKRSVDAFANHMLDRTGKTPFDIEYRLLKKNNEYSHFRATGETIRDENGNAIRVAGALMDITEEMKNLQLKLEIESTTLQAVIDNIPDHVFFKDEELHYTRANRSLLAHHDIDESDLIGKDDLNGLGVPVNVANDFRVTDNLVLLENRVIITEEFVPDLDGGLQVFETSKVPLVQNGVVTGIMGIARNITERKRMEEAAQSASRSKSIFLANISHEIRTPMNSIIGFSELAQHGDIPQKTKEYLANIQESAKWLLALVNDLLDISKIESGKVDLEVIPFDLPDVFAHCQAAIQPKAEEKGISLYCYAEPSVGKRMLGDPLRLRQVIMNLLSNAVKFTNTGTVKLLASIEEYNEEEESARMHFEVKDSGIGMRSEQIERIFEPFKQADESITRNFGGTGLGLTISKNLIELMGGTLCVESAPGIGSKFSFDVSFKLTDATTDRVSKKAVINEYAKPNFIGEVLICEDNKLNQQVICDNLHRVGLKTTVASNGEEGVMAVAERIKQNEKPFDLIFMDIHMPVMDGLEAASKITALNVDSPIVALTANIMSNDVEIYKENGMIDTLGKPFTTNELWRCLINLIPVESYTEIDEKRQSAEDNAVKKKLMVNFVKENQTTYADLLKAVESDDFKTAHRIAHTLKSNAAQIDEYELRDAAAIAEVALKDSSGIARSKLNKIKSEISKVLKKLSPLLDEEKRVSVSKITDINKVNEILDSLEPLLIDNSTKCIKLLDDIKAIPGSEDLAFHIEDYNFISALDALEKLKKDIGTDR